MVAADLEWLPGGSARVRTGRRIQARDRALVRLAPVFLRGGGNLAFPFSHLLRVLLAEARSLGGDVVTRPNGFRREMYRFVVAEVPTAVGGVGPC